MSDIVDRANRRRERTAQHRRRVETLASELAKFSPDFVHDFLQRMIADAGPHDQIRRDMADFADEVRNAIPEHRKRHGRPATGEDPGRGRRATSAGTHVQRNFTLIQGGKD
jgi:hypothetical protein